MFILDEPYISDFLLDTVAHHRIPVLENSFTGPKADGRNLHFLGRHEVVGAFRNGGNHLIYTNSENTIGWISRHLDFTDLPDKINLFKDKVRFRNMLRVIDPSFFFREASLTELDTFDASVMTYPFIVKPAVGFFSLGVHKVENTGQWVTILQKIKKEVAVIHRVYPAEVLDTTRFIIEEHIDGREFAFDAYFNEAGQPVILSLLEHLFSSPGDVSDRVYISSEAIFRNFLEPFTGFLENLGKLASLKNFPMHVEVRVDDKGRIRPIEINPLRFGGWCTTADMTWYAYGFNPYAAIARQEVPDWNRLLAGKEEKVYSNIVLTNATGHEVNEIRSFDYERLISRFENPLELRKADFKSFLIFGFLFAETSLGNFREIKWILNDDLTEFITFEEGYHQ